MPNDDVRAARESTGIHSHRRSSEHTSQIHQPQQRHKAYCTIFRPIVYVVSSISQRNMQQCTPQSVCQALPTKTSHSEQTPSVNPQHAHASVTPPSLNTHNNRQAPKTVTAKCCCSSSDVGTSTLHAHPHAACSSWPSCTEQQQQQVHICIHSPPRNAVKQARLRPVHML